ncbi:hypothetical protein B0T18DRAFT_441300 [Schizothecium vesticola]|uniref:Uncharacterized protein n=1 Tax=Schizothecium vesticola TaxID=314040 RepID=A0AA40BQM4_9PEZI|nr:hypothetical protein B0T18DRAFT_441300 [Schizothecium vesticola]
MGAPPPPPPHGENPRTTAGGPNGFPPGTRFDIFVIPEHSAGGGFIYLPSLQPSWNSFMAGSLAPAMRNWWQNFSGFGPAGWVLLLVAVGTEKASAGGPGSQRPGGGFAPPPNHAPPPHNNPPPPPPPPQPETPKRERPQSSWQDQPQPETPRTQEQPRHREEPRHHDERRREEPRHEEPPRQKERPREKPQEKARARQEPSPEKPREQSRPRPETPTPAPQPREKAAPPKPAPPPPQETPNADAKSAWEKAREETRRREEERRIKEAELKRKEETARRLRELREREAKERGAREREAREREAKEREKKEQEARERARIEREVREKLEKELKEKADQEAREREAREREAKEREARVRAIREREAREREAREREERERELVRMREEERLRVEADRKAKEAKEKEAQDHRLERERLRKEEEEREKEKARQKTGSYAYPSVGERTNMWPNGKPPASTQAPSSAASSPGGRPNPASPANPRPAPSPGSTATGVRSEETHSYRPYDKPKATPRKKSVSDFSESSWAPSTSTARTTPPPSRGPYTTHDPAKIVVKAVYKFMNQFSKTPVSTIIPGRNNVTDGLVLKIDTAGFQIDDDRRGVGQREWDVKAWTVKLIEVWCPTYAVNASASNTPGSIPTNHPFFKTMPTGARRTAERGATKTFVGEEAVAYFEELGRGCQGVCQRGLASAGKGSAAGSAHSDSSSKGLHIVRVTLRDQEGQRYLYVLDEEESWKLADRLKLIRGSSQVRSLGFAGLSSLEARSILDTLGFAQS